MLRRIKQGDSFQTAPDIQYDRRFGEAYVMPQEFANYHAMHRPQMTRASFGLFGEYGHVKPWLAHEYIADDGTDGNGERQCKECLKKRAIMLNYYSDCMNEGKTPHPAELHGILGGHLEDFDPATKRISNYKAYCSKHGRGHIAIASFDHASQLLFLMIEMTLSHLNHQWNPFGGKFTPSLEGVKILIECIGKFLNHKGVVTPDNIDDLATYYLQHHDHIQEHLARTQHLPELYELVQELSLVKYKSLLKTLKKKFKRNSKIFDISEAEVSSRPVTRRKPKTFFEKAQMKLKMMKMGVIKKRIMKKEEPKPVNSLDFLCRAQFSPSIGLRKSGTIELLEEVKFDPATGEFQEVKERPRVVDPYANIYLEVTPSPHEKRPFTRTRHASKRKKDAKPEPPNELPDCLLNRIKESGIYLDKSFVELIPQCMVSRASSMLFELPTPSDEAIQHIQSKRVLRGRDVTEDDTKVALLISAMIRGPQCMRKTFGLNILDSFIRGWVYDGIRIKKVSGRPVRDAMFDKLAMGSLKTLIDQGRLPFLDNTFLEEMQLFLRGTKPTNIYGWKRKFSKRYEKLLTDDPDYFSTALPDHLLDAYLQQVEEKLIMKRKFLYNKKKRIYDWYDASFV